MLSATEEAGILPGLQSVMFDKVLVEVVIESTFCRCARSLVLDDDFGWSESAQHTTWTTDHPTPEKAESRYFNFRSWASSRPPRPVTSLSHQTRRLSSASKVPA